jgi:hypothetical protein
MRRLRSCRVGSAFAYPVFPCHALLAHSWGHVKVEGMRGVLVTFHPRWKDTLFPVGVRQGTGRR